MDEENHRQNPTHTDMDYQLAGSVIAEMIDGIRMLQHLLVVAEKANVLKFDLDDLLVNYLGDVQLVADFDNYRNRMLDVFQAVMRRSTRPTRMPNSIWSLTVKVRSSHSWGS